MSCQIALFILFGISTRNGCCYSLITKESSITAMEKDKEINGLSRRCYVLDLCSI